MHVARARTVLVDTSSPRRYLATPVLGPPLLFLDFLARAGAELSTASVIISPLRRHSRLLTQGDAPLYRGDMHGQLVWYETRKTVLLPSIYAKLDNNTSGCFCRS